MPGPGGLPGLCLTDLIAVPGLGDLRVMGSIGPSVRHCVTPVGEHVVVKTGRVVADEAAGLSQLAAVRGGPPVPAVLHVGDALLITSWIPPGPRSTESERALGAALATLHDAPSGAWGGGSSWIGDCRVDPVPAPTAVDFYGSRLEGLLSRAGLSSTGRSLMERLLGRLDILIPPGAPRLLHGDLWWGNVLWSPDGAVLIDPSVHGGHPEEDLAMLGLFGPIPPSVLHAYVEQGPLEDGWRERVSFWQLYPLLVHAVLFGGSYRAEVEAVAARYH
jgi:fructosamine-3-kinase